MAEKPSLFFVYFFKKILLRLSYRSYLRVHLEDMRATFLILGILILFCTGAKCQDTEEIKDLMEALENAPEDSVKVNGLIELSKLYAGSDLQSAIKYGTEARDLAEKIGFQKGLGYAYKAIGIGYFNQSNYPEALIKYEQSLKIFEGIPFKTGIANMLSNIGVVYSNLGDDTKAIEHHLKALKVSEQIKDSLRIATSLNNLGVVYKNNKSAPAPAKGMKDDGQHRGEHDAERAPSDARSRASRSRGSR